MFGSFCRRKFLLFSAGIAGLAALLLTASGSPLSAGLGTKVCYFGLQRGNKPLTTSSTQSTTKLPSNFLISPFSRISQASAVSADRGARSAEIAFNADDNEYLVVWQSDGLTEVRSVSEIYGQRINGVTGQVIGINFRISNQSDADKHHGANDPQVVYNRTAGEYLVVWHGSGRVDAPDRFFEVYGQRLSRTGKEIGSDFQISGTTALGKVSTSVVRASSQADVAWNNVNNEYLVVWKGLGEPEDVVKTEVYGQRLKANGEALGKYFRISHTTDQGSNFHANSPAVAYNSRDNQYLVVWSGGFKNESQVEVWGVGLSAGGGALGPTNDFRISQVSTDVGANRRASSPHVVYNSANNEYFVVFQENALPGGVNADVNEIFGQRIDAAKLVETGVNDFRLSNTVGAGNRASRPTVNFNSVDKEYLVIWRSIRQSAPYEISGQRVSSTGAEIQGDFQISNIAAVGKDRSVNNAALAHNTVNGQYFVVWQGNALPGAAGAKINEIFGQQLAPARSR